MRATDLELPDDIVTLKALVRQQAAQLAEHEAALRHERARLAERERGIVRRDTTIEQLRAKLHLLLARRFGASAETIGDAQLGLFNEAEAEALCEEEQEAGEQEAASTVAAHSRQRPRRKPLPQDLPRVEIHHELPEAERQCPKHGVALERFAEDSCEQLDIIPARVQVLRHIRAKYRCPCCEGRIHTAPLPAQPIAKSLASPGLLAYIAAAKFVLAQPLYRQQKELQRLGCTLSRTTLAVWMVRCGQLVQPLINLLREQLLEAPYLLMDETTVQVLKEAGKAPETKSYLWVQMDPRTEQPVILFDYDPTRSSAVPVRLLEGFTGALHTDAYRGYDGAIKAGELTRLYCFAHARRKFVDVIKSLGLNPKKLPTPPPPAARRALKAIDFIKTLYVIERRIKDKPPDERRAVRQRDSLPVLEKLHAWAKKTEPLIMDGSELGKALRYLNRHWDGLTRYVEDGRYGIDTNPVENAIRPFAIGRKNWNFSDTVAGATSSANLYSLIETAKANGLDPYGYLRHVFTMLPSAITLEHVEALLPWQVEHSQLVFEQP